MIVDPNMKYYCFLYVFLVITWKMHSAVFYKNSLFFEEYFYYKSTRINICFEMSCTHLYFLQKVTLLETLSTCVFQILVFSTMHFLFITLYQMYHRQLHKL